jgi:hypothetical protein
MTALWLQTKIPFEKNTASHQSSSKVVKPRWEVEAKESVHMHRKIDVRSTAKLI